MRTSQILLATQKETPSDAEVISHQLMLKSGMIRKSASGLYSWLPMGLCVLKKVENIVRDEMNKAGAQELLMPMVQPAHLWQESQRWDAYGKELLTFTDRHENSFCLGPTHEEVILDIMRNELQSYKQLPQTFYQIQTKFRDEIRPRFGVMRAREFLMKDAYSFHLDNQSLEETYQIMHQAYTNIFTRLGLKFRPVIADSGSIGGKTSHEFHVLAQSGEDEIAYCPDSNYAANTELATSLIPESKTNQTKTVYIQNQEKNIFGIVLDHQDELNLIKASKHNLINSPVVLIDKVDPNNITAVLYDHCVEAENNSETYDFRMVQSGDVSPDNQGKLEFVRGIEVGHIFQLETKYSDVMDGSVLNQNGKKQNMAMGCYGIGISRIVAAAIEQNHDDNGIIWPDAIAPYHVAIIPIKYQKSQRVREACDDLYSQLTQAGFSVLLDDRNERPGVMFADMDLIGIPNRIVLGERGLDNNEVEFKRRDNPESENIKLDEIIQTIKSHELL